MSFSDPNESDPYTFENDKKGLEEVLPRSRTHQRNSKLNNDSKITNGSFVSEGRNYRFKYQSNWEDIVLCKFKKKLSK